MRVITGSCRGKKLKTMEGLDTRPTTDMVKEAVFSAVQFDVPGARILDLFAGSGQLGIEALSRGASHCVFVDSNPSALAIVRENVSSCGFNSASRILGMDSLEYLKVAKKAIDIAFLDPPYGKGLIEKALPSLENILSENGIAVCEHERELTLPDEFGRLKVHKRYKYGKISVTIYKIPREEE
jgi:16S rRNA (guanine(966)-N(2))-methyltransferase RsmD